MANTGTEISLCVLIMKKTDKYAMLIKTLRSHDAKMKARITGTTVRDMIVCRIS